MLSLLNAANASAKRQSCANLAKVNTACVLFNIARDSQQFYLYLDPLAYGIMGIHEKRIQRNQKRKICRKRKTSKTQYLNLKEKVTSLVPFTYNSQVKLFISRCQIRKTSRTMAKISKYHILESNNNTGQYICHKILSTNIDLTEPYMNINLDSVILALSPILESFKYRHNRFNYFDKLKYTIARNSQRYETQENKTRKDKMQKFKHQIDVRLVQAFFSLLLYEIVPLELFGTSRNRKLIKYTIYNLLNTVPSKIPISKSFKRTIGRTTNAIGGILDIKPLFEKLDISQIQWLHSINNTVQWIIILKLLHWFFAQYIIKILHKYVVLQQFKKQWVYITKDNWCNMQEEFIKEKENTRNLVPYTQLNNKCNIGIYKFVPSSSGLRALFITKNNNKEKYDDNTDVVLRFLQQLYVTYFDENGLPTLKGCENAIRKFTSEFKNQPLYYVCCDIQDAFGSINQKKLYDIIDTHCKKLYEKYGEYLAVRTFSLTTTVRSRTRTTKRTVQVLEHYLKRSIFKGNVIPSKEKPKLVSIQRLNKRIYKLIHQRKVKFNGCVYSIKKLGVPQGASVSPILSDIYYQDMMKEIFSEYFDNGLLYRYVDDMLYITDSEEYAARFLKIIKSEEGIPEYNVKFNKKKIVSNAEQPYRSTPVTFLKQIHVTL